MSVFGNVSWLAVLISVVAMMILGMLWYSPILFGKIWARELDIDLSDKEKVAEMKKTAGPGYVFSLLTAAVTAVVLSVMYDLIGTTSFMEHWVIMLLLWLGFTIPAVFGGKFWGNQSFKFVNINAGYYLVGYTVIVAIVCSFM